KVRLRQAARNARLHKDARKLGKRARLSKGNLAKLEHVVLGHLGLKIGNLALQRVNLRLQHPILRALRGRHGRERSFELSELGTRNLILSVAVDHHALPSSAGSAVRTIKRIPFACPVNLST